MTTLISCMIWTSYRKNTCTCTWVIWLLDDWYVTCFKSPVNTEILKSFLFPSDFLQIFTCRHYWLTQNLIYLQDLVDIRTFWKVKLLIPCVKRQEKFWRKHIFGYSCLELFSFNKNNGKVNDLAKTAPLKHANVKYLWFVK